MTAVEFYNKLPGNRVSQSDLKKCREHFAVGSKEYTNLSKAIKLANLSRDKTIIISAEGFQKSTKKTTGLLGITNSADVQNMKFQSLGFTGVWKEFIGLPEPNFAFMVYGLAGQGKSILCFQMASYLGNFGKVLYVAGEEGIGLTLQQKLMEAKVDTSKLDIMAGKRLKDHVSKAIKDNGYKFVILDSITSLEMTGKDVEILREENPNTAFICIVQCRKDGKYYGGQDLSHNVDTVIQVKSGVATTDKNRFGGHSPYQIFPKQASNAPKNEAIGKTNFHFRGLSGVEKKEYANELESMGLMLASLAKIVNGDKLDETHIQELQGIWSALGGITRKMKRSVVVNANVMMTGKKKTRENQSNAFKKSWRNTKARAK